MADADRLRFWYQPDQWTNYKTDICNPRSLKIATDATDVVLSFIIVLA